MTINELINRLEQIEIESGGNLDVLLCLPYPDGLEFESVSIANVFIANSVCMIEASQEE
jgi:hypothetical protein